MERFSALRTVVLLLTAVVAAQTGLLAWVLFPGSAFIWAGLGTVVVVQLYLVCLSLGLLRELKESKQNNTTEPK